VVWTIPSSYDTLQQVIETVKAKEIHLFAVEPEGTRLESFQVRLAGLVKYALSHKGGRISINELAAAMAHQVATVEAGLEWLQAHGDICCQSSDAMLAIEPGGKPDEAGIVTALARLQELLAETAAFRAYYFHAGKRLLVD
jgi:hypothetical protein